MLITILLQDVVKCKYPGDNDWGAVCSLFPHCLANCISLQIFFRSVSAPHSHTHTQTHKYTTVLHQSSTLNFRLRVSNSHKVCELVKVFIKPSPKVYSGYSNQFNSFHHDDHQHGSSYHYTVLENFITS